MILLKHSNLSKMERLSARIETILCPIRGIDGSIRHYIVYKSAIIKLAREVFDLLPGCDQGTLDGIIVLVFHSLGKRWIIKSKRGVVKVSNRNWT